MTKRIQRRRTKGWRMPENAVCVTRPGVFGNPWKVTDQFSAKDAVEAFAEWLRGAHESWSAPRIKELRKRLLARLPELVGKDLACYCALPNPGEPDVCHGAVLLELARKLGEKASAAE